MFEVIIRETREVRKLQPKKWEKLGEEMKECSTYGEKKQTYKADVMGYAPEVETLAMESVLVLQQNVEQLNLPAVIKAINGF